MKTIWKTPIEIVDEQTVKVSKNAQALTVEYQGNQACMWWVVDPSEELVEETIHIYGTGQPIDDDQWLNEYYVGTLHDTQRGFVWHVFIEFTEPIELSA